MVDTPTEVCVWLKTSAWVGESTSVDCHDEFGIHQAATSLVMMNCITEAFRYF